MIERYTYAYKHIEVGVEVNPKNGKTLTWIG